MGIGIIIGVLIASLVWCIIMLKLNEDWGNECIKQILEVNDEWFESCKELNESWAKYCEKMINKYYADKEGEDD